MLVGVARTIMVQTAAMKVAAPPEKGKANDALIAFLASHFKVTRDDVTILSGHGTLLKLVRIEDK